jgi:DNA repair exonuclease SbcCD ATPase subunit
MSTRSTDASSTGPEAPRTVSAVLCREVGAQHPDGALKQIRTMKRLLRSHYRVKQRLEDYGVESLEEAVSHIATLTRRLERTRQRQRERARRRLTVIEALLDKMDGLRSQATGPAAPDTAPNTAPDTAPDTAPAGEAPPPLKEALDLVEALSAELNELRLELWLQESADAAEEASGSAAAALLDRLDEALTDTTQLLDRLRRDRRALREQNTQLQRTVERLQETVDRQQAQLEALDAPRPAPARPPADA